MLLLLIADWTPHLRPSYALLPTVQYYTYSHLSIIIIIIIKKKEKEKVWMMIDKRWIDNIIVLEYQTNIVKLAKKKRKREKKTTTRMCKEFISISNTVGNLFQHIYLPHPTWMKFFFFESLTKVCETRVRSVIYIYIRWDSEFFFDFLIFFLIFFVGNAFFNTLIVILYEIE